uniref:Uncharacterized protein n=1 Tax=Anabas testudineus TaxID=64144 RepID=A0A3Q1H745_ANATE
MKVVFTKHPLIVLQTDLPRRADPTELKHASIKKNDECFMSPQDLVVCFLHAHTDIDEATKLLAGVVDKGEMLSFLAFYW